MWQIFLGLNAPTQAPAGSPRKSFGPGPVDGATALASQFNRPVGSEPDPEPEPQAVQSPRQPEAASSLGMPPPGDAPRPQSEAASPAPAPAAKPKATTADLFGDDDGGDGDAEEGGGLFDAPIAQPAAAAETPSTATAPSEADDGGLFGDAPSTADASEADGGLFSDDGGLFDAPAPAPAPAASSDGGGLFEDDGGLFDAPTESAEAEATAAKAKAEVLSRTQSADGAQTAQPCKSFILADCPLPAALACAQSGKSLRRPRASARGCAGRKKLRQLLAPAAAMTTTTMMPYELLGLPFTPDLIGFDLSLQPAGLGRRSLELRTAATAVGSSCELGGCATRSAAKRSPSHHPPSVHAGTFRYSWNL